MTNNLCCLIKSLMNVLVFILITTRKQKTWSIYTLKLMNLLKNLIKIQVAWSIFFDYFTIDKAAHKAPGSMPLLYERMISNLQSEKCYV